MPFFKSKPILVPWDFSTLSRSAAAHALELAESPDQIEVVHVATYPSAGDRSLPWAESKDEIRQNVFQIFQNDMGDSPIAKLKFTTLFGDPGSEIADLAKQRDADLIVISSHGRTGLSRVLLGSVAERVVRLAPCPVLVLRGNKKEEGVKLDTQAPLIAEFLKDHQQFSRLLLEIRNLLADGNLDRARERAVELNRLAGPHIAYEELELYPRLEELTGKEVTESELVDQHHEILDSLRRLIEDETISENEVGELQSGFEMGLAHAEHCGSLISLMSRLSAEAQSKSLIELERLRSEGTQWTELESV